jgi:hypothetical protein
MGVMSRCVRTCHDEPPTPTPFSAPGHRREPVRENGTESDNRIINITYLYLVHCTYGINTSGSSGQGRNKL